MSKNRSRIFNPKKQDSGLDIEEIIAAPLLASAKANSMMLSEQTKFLMDFCFTLKDDGSYDPVLIEMSLTKAFYESGDENKESGYMRHVQTTFQLPLLTIIPINSLAVDNVSVDFEMEITSQVTKDAEKSSVNNPNFGTPGETTQLRGKISYDSKEQNSSSYKGQKKTQNNSKLTVHVNASPLPLPVGVTALLEMYIKSIHPLPKKEPEKLTGDNVNK